MTSVSTLAIPAGRRNVSLAGAYLVGDLLYHLAGVPNVVGNATGALSVPIVSFLEVALGVLGIVVARRLLGTYRQATDLPSRFAAATAGVLAFGMAAFDFLFAAAILLLLFGD